MLTICDVTPAFVCLFLRPIIEVSFMPELLAMVSVMSESTKALPADVLLEDTGGFPSSP